jgi:hypothetical protein
MDALAVSGQQADLMTVVSQSARDTSPTSIADDRALDQNPCRRRRPLVDLLD